MAVPIRCGEPHKPGKSRRSILTWGARALGLATVLVLAMSFMAPAQGDTVTGAEAVQDGEFSRLWMALRLDETLEIVREEGHEYAIEAAIDLTGRPADAFWHRTVREIYDIDRMTQRVKTDMAQALRGKELGPVLAYYESSAGAKVIDLEISARRAYLSPGVDEAAREEWLTSGKKGQRGALIRRIVDDADLIDRNVAGALNSNFAFLVAFARFGPNDGALVDEMTS